jgi:GAF domain-containing protein
VVIRDIEDSPLIEPETRPVLQAMGVLSMMVMPLQISGEIVGTVGFDLFQPSQQFTPELIGTAATMLSQVAIGLQNIRLLSEAESRAEQLQRIALFGQSVQATLNLDAILDILLTEIPQLIPAQRIDVALSSARQGSLRSVAHYADGQRSVDTVNAVPVALDQTFVGQVWQMQELLDIADTQALPVHPTDYDPALRSLLIAPIRSRGQVLGIVTIGSTLPYRYTETDQAIFQQMINQLAVALENAQAFEQSQRATKNEALINDISTQFQRRSAVEDMLEVAISELGTALGARRGRIRLKTRTDGERSEVES